MAVSPVVYGQSTRPPRGDYSHANSDYTCSQHHNLYTPQEHAIYRQLYTRQLGLIQSLACDAFIDALPMLGVQDSIPHFEDINIRLAKATGWELVGVPGLIPELPFFSLLAQRKFPVTTWIRTPEELDYIAEPDVFHDLFGHVPLLFDNTYAEHLEAWGQGALKAQRLEHSRPELKGAVEMLSRLYWYTIEFGLLREKGAIRAYGAGLLSSAGELAYSITAIDPSRQPLQTQADLLACMGRPYNIDTYQSQYFVIDSFVDLLRLTQPDFTPYYERLAQQA
jgi:phenylalanine-4-hydroxylase